MGTGEEAASLAAHDSEVSISGKYFVILFFFFFFFFFFCSFGEALIDVRKLKEIWILNIVYIIVITVLYFKRDLSLVIV